MSRDASHDVLVLGRSLERVDMTARLLAARIGTGARERGWTATLRACSAHDAYLRTYQHGVEPPGCSSSFWWTGSSRGRSSTLSAPARRRWPGSTRRPGDPHWTNRPGGRSAGPVPTWSSCPRRACSTICRSGCTGCSGPCRQSVSEVTRRLFAGSAPLPDWSRRGCRVAMSWRIAVEHRTGYRYAGPVRASYNEARLTPPHVDGQRTLQAPSTSRPPVRPLRYVDYWGTTVHAFDVHVPAHRTGRAGDIHRGDRSAAARAWPASGWTDLTARHGPGPLRRAAGRLTATSRPSRNSSRSGQSLRAEPTPVAGRPAGRRVDPRGAALRAGRHPRAHLVGAGARGRAGASARTSPTSPWRCCARSGCPARYVSGYLHPARRGGRARRPPGRATPGWSIWAGTGSAVDPTSLAEVADRHVLLARGRDYADVRPLSGVYAGGAGRGTVRRHRRGDPAGAEPAVVTGLLVTGL